ncbi:MAG: adenylate/guanylate cyclase domain-containing protein [Candidatus Rokubacteria bacterium]|nr:adenylate/guanylate cyclase domain-containing protein [Candidatus Rokubacteria bacterium]
MTESGEDRRLEELIASLRAVHEGQQALVQELRLLQQEIRALREELGARAVRAEAPVAPAPVPAPEPTRRVVAPPQPKRAWREGFASVLAKVPRPFGEVPRSLLERTWLLALVVGVLVVGARELNLFQPVEVLAEYPKGWVRPDQSRGGVVKQVVVVAIDDESVAKLGEWGARWRGHHGQLLKILAEDGARSVGFDVLFSVPNAEHDPPFLEGIRHARSKGTGVVVGMSYDTRQERLRYPASPVREAVTEVASVYLQPDRVTNLIRYVSMFQPDGAAGGEVMRLVPAFSVAVALAGGKRLEDFPRYREGLVPIEYAGPSSKTFQIIPYADVYETRFPPGSFKGKYVLVGMFREASKDFFDTPVESQMPGVVIHANALYTLLRGVARPIEFPWSAVVIFAVASVAAIICGRFRRTPRVVLVAALVVGYWGLAISLGLMRNPVSLEVIPATVAAGLVWASVTAREKIVAMRELRRSLGLPEEAVRRLEQDRAFQQGTLGKRVTILASDVRNYSAFSYSHPPTHVRQIMTEYQQMVERVVYRHGGYVNKFVGDAVVAVFGYPMYEEATGLRTILAAKEMREGLAGLVEKWKRENREGITDIRIGINTGLVSISYLGSAKKQLDVMGDNVDLAARLESAQGEFDCLALLGPTTYEEVKHRIRSRTVPVTLKNRPDVPQAFTFDRLVDEVVAVGRPAEA